MGSPPTQPTAGRRREARHAPRRGEGLCGIGLGDRRRLIGWCGEALAAAWLLLHGYRIAGWRVRLAGVQVDLLAARGPLLLVVEVKTRLSRQVPEPADLLSRRQRARLERAASLLASRHGKVTRVDLL